MNFIKSNLTPSAFRYLSVLFLSVFLFSCKGEAGLPELEGRYQGQQVLASGERIQVVAQIPDYVSVDQAKVLRFKTYPTLGSATGSEFRIAIINEKNIRLRLPGLPDSEIALSKVSTKDDCAAGAVSGQSVRLCWAKGKLDVEVQGGSEVSTLNLVRDDSLPPLPGKEGSGKYTLDELVGRARFLNYTVSQEAERVFQAKENIKVARGNLLPSLNIKTVLGLVAGDYIGAIGKLLPFLFPSNWFKWKAQKDLFEAEKKSFASLRGNEMNSVEGLYYSIYRDQAVVRVLNQHIEWMRKTQANLAKEEEVGTLPTGTAEYFGATIAMLEQDQIAIDKLVKNEYAELAQAVALPPLNGISELAPLSIPDLSSVKPIHAGDFFREVQEKSYEIKTLNALLKASKSLTKDVIFGFLDPEGVGLGFGTASSIRVSKSREHEVKKKIDETYSLMELVSAEVASEYNAALSTYGVARKGLTTVEKRLSWLMKRHLNGDPSLDQQDFIDQLIDLQLRILDFSADQWTGLQAYLMARSKLERLRLQGFYQDLEGSIPEDPEKLKEYEKNGMQENSAPALL